MQACVYTTAFALIVAAGPLKTGDDRQGEGWRALPLITSGKINPAWVHVGYGRFAVDDGALQAVPDEQGLGLLVYTKEKFGDCQLRLVYKARDAQSNSGLYIRIDDGILSRLNEKHAPAKRNGEGKLTPDSLRVFQEASEKGTGPWYAVHHGYEVQLCDAGNGMRTRTGAVYSLAASSALPSRPPTEWREVVVTLDGNRVRVDIDGRQVTDFDPDSRNVPTTREWYEPKREPKRPKVGYIGLQTHDPGDLVFFREIGVRSLPVRK